jgi:hypothetical protein
MRLTRSLTRSLLIPLVGSSVALGLLATPRLTHAQQITDPSPAVAAVEVDPNSPISASFKPANGVSVRPETVKVFVDGKDVTSTAVITKDFFSYRPTTPLPPGEHDVLVEFTNTQNTTRRVTWSFTVSTPVNVAIDSVVHNAGNRALGTGEIMLITVNGTPNSKVTLYLVQDGQKLQTLNAQEVSSGIYVANKLVQPQDRTREGIVVARLERQGEVRFATAEQPIRLIEGAVSTSQTLTTQDVSASIVGQGQQLLPQLTNYKDGDRVTGNSFQLQGQTLPGASVQIQVSAERSIGGGFINASTTLVNQTVQADSQGRFQLTVSPAFPSSGTTYQITLKASANGQTSPTVTVNLVQQ